ncbi:MAG TPA: hypothetical protein VMR28_03560 [Candidatus Saccharimonadales bacterium]|nr:hypothetical protein [Candidatus Saccharimonadales bacterium]
MYSPHSNLLWENEDLTIVTPVNPHIPYKDGLHLVVAPKIDLSSAWQDTDFSSYAFKVAAKACSIMRTADIAPWFNIQANGNWGLLPGKKPFFHIHIYGRNKTDTWGKPIVLPMAPNTYNNKPMPEADQTKLKNLFKTELTT